MNNQNGSSLVEVIVAMLVLALLVTGLNACVVNLVNTNNSSKELATATAAGNQALEMLRKTAYSSLQSNNDEVESKYVRAWTVTDNGSHKKIEMFVCWPKSSVKHTISLSTIIAKP